MNLYMGQNATSKAHLKNVKCWHKFVVSLFVLSLFGIVVDVSFFGIKLLHYFRFLFFINLKKI